MPLFRRGERKPGPESPASPEPAGPSADASLSPLRGVAAAQRPASQPVPDAAAVARFTANEGDLPCRQRGCPNHNGAPCNYVDRRGRRCDTSWCPNHWATIGGIVYCRRHAGTIAAIGYFEHPAGMPDVDNRAPSLVNWVARDLDPFVAATLVQCAEPGETFVREPVVSTYVDRAGGRRYERAWKLVDHTGLRLSVGVFVYGEEDVTIRVRVGTALVAEGVPPWIERRQRGLEVSAEVDRNQRALFYGFLQKHLLAAVRAQRAGEERFQER